MSSSYKEVPLSENSDLLNMSDFNEFGIPMKDSSAVNANGPSIPTGPMNSGSTAISSGTVDIEANTLSSGLSGALSSFLKNAAHPFVCLFHLLFKVLSIAAYWFVYMLTKDVNVTFILTTIFLSLDFWTVKNVTGRILVKLRWWNKINELDGTSEWIFESGEKQLASETSSVLDKNVFWIGLYAFPVFWVLAAVSNFLSFSPNFFILNLMGLMFSGTNALGYTKCSRSGQQAVQSWAQNQVAKAVFSSNKILSSTSESSV